jgi:hypothetical protein
MNRSFGSICRSQSGHRCLPMPGSVRPCSAGSPTKLTLSKPVRSPIAFAEPCEKNAKSDPWRVSPFHSASASPSGLRSSRTELYPLRPSTAQGMGQIKPPKWAKPTCQTQFTSQSQETDAHQHSARAILLPKLLPIIYRLSAVYPDWDYAIRL